MRAMQLWRTTSVDQDDEPLRLAVMEEPEPGDGELLIRVTVCGVCHTELDEIEGRAHPPRLPVVPGHQVVGRVVRLGGQVTGWRPGDRVGVSWIYSACGRCPWCRSGRENLCPDFQGTGRDRDGGYAEYLVARAAYAVPIPEGLTDQEVAPLLCAGAIGYRSLELAGLEDGQRLGLTGFGASAHLVLQMARRRYPSSPVYVFARSEPEREFALAGGAAWAGDTRDKPPVPVDAVIDTTPAWTPVVAALANLAAGGRLVINAIRKEEFDKSALLAIDYPVHLWQEKEVKSVANVTRRDVRACLELAVEAGIRPRVTPFRLEDANRALVELKRRHVLGAKVLCVSPSSDET